VCHPHPRYGQNPALWRRPAGTAGGAKGL
jgi:hypothetical protein